MASTTTNMHTAPRGRDVNFTDAALRALARVARLSPHYRRIAAYSALSDTELAARGMTRADVAERVFGPRLYL